MTHLLESIKTKISKWGLIKFKSFFTTKETINKVKRQPSELEKIIGNETTTDKGLISNIQMNENLILIFSYLALRTLPDIK